MEKTHYTAKSAFQRHTQHGGGIGRINPIVQTNNGGTGESNTESTRMVSHKSLHSLKTMSSRLGFGKRQP
jgi:hypothetical protein